MTLGELFYAIISPERGGEDMNIMTNLPGRIRNTNLPKSHALLPLFEAVVNSIHAIYRSVIGLLSVCYRSVIGLLSVCYPSDNVVAIFGTGVILVT